MQTEIRTNTRFSMKPTQDGVYKRCIKRPMDFILSMLAIIVLGPILLNEFLMKIVMKVISNGEIKIYDGKQKIELLDVRDAADAIVALLKTDYRKWNKTYNLSAGRTYTLDEVVRIISLIGKE